MAKKLVEATGIADRIDQLWYHSAPKPSVSGLRTWLRRLPPSLGNKLVARVLGPATRAENLVFAFFSSSFMRKTSYAVFLRVPHTRNLQIKMLFLRNTWITNRLSTKKEVSPIIT